MRLGLLSDVHCNLGGLKQALSYMDDCDEILCAGDINFQYRLGSDVLRLLQTRGVISVLGNHDKALVYDPRHPIRTSENTDMQAFAYLSSLPERLTLTLDGREILLVHGAPWDSPESPDSTYVYPNDRAGVMRAGEVDADVVVLGHTHHAMAVESCGTLIVNPGSCGVPRSAQNELSCAILDLSSMSCEFFTFSEDA